MDVFTMVVIIVVVTTVAGVFNNYLKNKDKAESKLADTALGEELDELRQRIEVLESIVTDQKYQLHRDLTELEKSA
ncbi:MAG: hypothetical protein NXH95_02115 [Pseudomonadaceae bacterium]|nr:hypothetical protein [Pseudomonadaceae bacterium]